MKTLGIVLAGGKSTRMKQDKANLSWHGRPLLEHMSEVLVKVPTVERVLISGRRGSGSIEDLEQSLGPLEGLRSALSSSVVEIGTAALVVPIDMPFLTEKILSQLFEEEQATDAVSELNEVLKRPPEKSLGALIFDGHQLPALFLDAQAVLSQIEELRKKSLQEGPSIYSFKELFKQMNVKKVSVRNPKQLINVNTPEDWNEAISKTDYFT